ncbi:MAG: hypothetical protein MK105_05205 [Crocinitomicaceae bacterium]|nr:hypothetical protein [Crocinitomicaceae bacterium]
MKYLIVLFLLVTINSFAQERAKLIEDRQAKAKRIELAEKQIVQLKNGVLLVRLNFREKEIAYYEGYGNTKGAEKTRKKQLKRNLKIAEGFKETFKFCPVYFFSMADSRKLIDGKLDSVTFYGYNLKPNDSITLSHTDYFIGEFGQTEQQDTTAYYKGSTPNTGSESNPEGKTYYGGDKFILSALVLRDKNFNQLRDPFPYFGRYNPAGSINKRYIDAMKKLEASLNKFYSKVVGVKLH